ncbi:IS600 ORF2 [Shigella sonnei]|nr:IS600 ORF2 [Shigella sonnei]
MPFYFRKECPLNSGYLIILKSRVNTPEVVMHTVADVMTGNDGEYCFHARTGKYGVYLKPGWHNEYIAGIKDVYTCEIVGYAMGERMTKELTGKALFMALRSQRPPAGLIHHSDRGSQYCAYDYRVIQEQSGLKTSMSRKGNCYDNAPMESFWGTLKNESLSHYRFNNRDEAISVIREYIEIFYNRQRRHSRLGNISPAAFREKYHQMAA